MGYVPKGLKESDMTEPQQWLLREPHALLFASDLDPPSWRTPWTSAPQNPSQWVLWICMGRKADSYLLHITARHGTASLASTLWQLNLFTDHPGKNHLLIFINTSTIKQSFGIVGIFLNKLLETTASGGLMHPFQPSRADMRMQHHLLNCNCVSLMNKHGLDSWCKYRKDIYISWK